MAFPGRVPGHVQILDLAALSQRRPSANDAASSNPANEEAISQLASDTGSLTLSETGSQSKPQITRTLHTSILPAHTTHLAALAINFDGNRLATASTKGTLIRIFDTLSGRLLNELRRGTDRAAIWSIAFNRDSTRICVGSETGTVHIFNLDTTTNASSPTSDSHPTQSTSTQPSATQSVSVSSSSPPRPIPSPRQESRHEDNEDSDEEIYDHVRSKTWSETVSNGNGSGRYGNTLINVVEKWMGTPPSLSATGNRQSSLSFMKDLLPRYFSSEWSFAYCYLPFSSDHKFLCLFGREKDSIVVVAYDGTYYKYVFDGVKGGEATRVEFLRYLHLE